MKISSKNQRVLVFSDYHQEVKNIQRIIDHEKADVIVDLGDCFDSHFYDLNNDVLNTVKFQTELLKQDNYIGLFGNHTLSYFVRNALCSGWEERKQKIINSNFDKKLIRRFKFHVFIDDYLCTHAGLHSNFIPRNLDINNEVIDDWLSNEYKYAFQAIETNERHWFWTAGRARGGFSRVGGIVWLDFHEEFVPITGLNQIVGHSHVEYVKFENKEKSTNLCIDTNLRQYLIIHNGNIEIKDSNDI